MPVLQPMRKKEKKIQYIQFPPIKDLYRINDVFLSVPCTTRENDITDLIQNLDKVHQSWEGAEIPWEIQKEFKL